MMEGELWEKTKSNENIGMDVVQSVSTFRRISPQVLAAMAKNLIIFTAGEYYGCLTIIIPALTGLNKDLNPNETLVITANQASWLLSITSAITPIGCLLGAPLSDAVGRRKTLMIANLFLISYWIIMGFSQSFLMIFTSFVLFGLTFGLCDPSLAIYGIEICEPTIRGTMGSISLLVFLTGSVTTVSFGAIFSWRHVCFISALMTLLSSVALLLVPESPHWLLSKDRLKEARRSLQWLRGWVSPQTVHEEFNKLQHYNNTSNACSECTNQLIKCGHPKPTLWDKLKYLKKRQNIRPFILIMFLEIFGSFNVSRIWNAYIIQVLTAFGSPIKPTVASVINSWVLVLGSTFCMLTVKKLGRRKIYLTSMMFIAIGSFISSIYGFVLLPPGWTSVKVGSNEQQVDHETAADMVGKYSYLALITILVVNFFGGAGPESMFGLYNGEVFPFKSRSFMCGICKASSTLLQSVVTKTYYNIELWLSLPGATTFYGVFSATGLIVMYLIMPDTEQRSLEDIERHYSDRTKRLTDIYIPKQTEIVENK